MPIFHFTGSDAAAIASAAPHCEGHGRLSLGFIRSATMDQAIAAFRASRRRMVKKSFGPTSAEGIAARYLMAGGAVVARDCGEGHLAYRAQQADGAQVAPQFHCDTLSRERRTFAL